MFYLTRREHFNAAHRLYRPEYSDEKNLEIFGKCSNPNWHGHNYNLFVTVTGNLNPETGFVINLKTLSQIIKNQVIDKIDHKNINLEVDFMKDKMASTEVLAKAIFDVLLEPVRQAGGKLFSVRIEETENNIVEYTGEN
ncbi:MAG: 6-pyruvoyl tetrahydropterin synthase family protein [Bacteroidales bacterium]